MTQPPIINKDNNTPFPDLVYGTATQTGSNNTLVDSTKSWAKNIWFGCALNVYIGTQLFTTTIIGNTATVLTFSPALTVQVFQGSQYKIVNSVMTVASGQMRPGIALNENQQMLSFVVTLTDRVVVPYIIPWIQAPLAPGAITRVYNTNTGLVSPFTVAAGYSLSIIENRFWFNQDVDGALYFDGMMVSSPIGAGSGVSVNVANIAYYTTKQIDPDSLLPHTLDLQIMNRGLVSNMMGAATLTVILEAEHTPPFPTQKDTGCPFCGKINNVPVEQTVVECAGCGKTYILFDTTKIRRT